LIAGFAECGAKAFDQCRVIQAEHGTGSAVDDGVNTHLSGDRDV
jgi:hypothetical protein